MKHRHSRRSIPGLFPVAILLLVGTLRLTILTVADDAQPIRRVLPLPVDLNSADAARLQLLDGIGPTLARRIIDDRTRHGRFRSVDELDRVPRIGPATIDRLRRDVFAGSGPPG